MSAGSGVEVCAAAECQSYLQSWQSPYAWPFVTNQSREENLRIERLIDNLIFLVQDVPDAQMRDQVLDIRNQLEDMGVYFEEQQT